MKPFAPSVRRLCLGLLSAALLLPATAPAGFLDVLFPGYELEAITVTEMTPAGALLPSASPADPVYYAAVSGGYLNLGGIKAGEKPVQRQLVNEALLKALAKQGYLPASEQHPAEIVLVWTWGTLNTQRSLIAPFSTPSNHQELLRFLGGEKVGLGSRLNDAFPEQTLLPGLIYDGFDAERLIEAAKDDLYFLVVTAYDARSQDAKRPITLWTTRISSPSRGFWLPEVMPAMVAIGSPYIGRDTAKPVWIRATEKFTPDIKLGDTRIVEYLSSQTPNVVEVGSAR